MYLLEPSGDVRQPGDFPCAGLPIRAGDGCEMGEANTKGRLSEE